MSLFQQEAVSDGTLIELGISIDYLSRSDITVHFDGVEAPLDSGWSWVGASSSLISFSPAVANGVGVIVRRTTSIEDPVHVYNSGAMFRKHTLDESFAQILYYAQEFAATAGNFENDVLPLPPTAAPSVGNSLTGSRSDHVHLAQTASTVAFTPAGTIAANSVQSAIAEVSTESAASVVAAAAVAASATAAVATTVSDNAAALASPAGSGLLGFVYATVYAAGSVGKWLQDLAGSTGTSFIGFLQSGVNAVSRTLQSKLRETVSVTDFGATGDGTTDDILAIERAIACVVLRGGGEVLFPYPVVKYVISRGIKVPSNVTLRGLGSRPVIHNTGSTYATFDQAAVVINANWYTTGNVNIHITNLTLRNRYQDFLTPVATAELESRYGVFFGGVTGFSITNCHMLDCPAEAVYIGGIAGVGGLCSDGVIQGNKCENSFASGIAITNGTRLRVTHNLIINSNIFGIDVEPNTGCVGTHITIANNVVDGVQATYYKNTTTYGKSNGLGILVTSGSLPNQVFDVAVSGNTVRNVQRWTVSGIFDFAAISVVGGSGISVVGNTVESCGSCGIVVRGASRSVAVTGNTISNMYWCGIIFASTSVNCSATGNTLDTVGATGIIVWDSCSKITITGNTVKDPTGAGIYVQAATVVSITGNIVYDSRAGGARLCTYGIHVSSACANVPVTGNTIFNTTSDPTRDVDASTNVVMGPNTEDGSWRMRSTNFHLFSDGHMYKVGWIKQTACSTGTAAVGSLFVDSADNRLKFKDAASAINLLYFTAQAAAAASLSTLFIDTADSKLKFKDGAGVVNALY